MTTFADLVLCDACFPEEYDDDYMKMMLTYLAIAWMMRLFVFLNHRKICLYTVIVDVNCVVNVGDICVIRFKPLCFTQ